jgi:hypothetical protein
MCIDERVLFVIVSNTITAPKVESCSTGELSRRTRRDAEERVGLTFDDDHMN